MGDPDARGVHVLEVAVCWVVLVVGGESDNNGHERGASDVIVVELFRDVHFD